MAKLIICEMCDMPATYTIQPDGGSISYWCDKHFKQTVKEIKS